ncbi:putative secreted proline rich protein [Isosphaera pallida ATCC 43644]|uniref:Secreted proline rich protein n=1 Tax=Isosphaera pallida (strain ATCC 43644 / DSM 9630 / IS1B) TaxID=575540 RepID=E8QWK5_ISOPI|nr:hypothetical protein [Isosphaera pallida]ADV61897.1 putative secreted proline rich protein [Isosphaera pallida ATCC 43644]
MTRPRLSRAVATALGFLALIVGMGGCEGGAASPPEGVNAEPPKTKADELPKSQPTLPGSVDPSSK